MFCYVKREKTDKRALAKLLLSICILILDICICNINDYGLL